MRLICSILAIVFSFTVAEAREYHYKYTQGCHEAYNHYLSLRIDEANDVLKRELIADPYNLMATYLSDYDDCLTLLFNGSELDYEQRKHHLNARLKLLDKGDENSPWHRLCKAALYMHWAFVNVRFRDNIKAAANFRRSFLLLKENERLFPDFEYDDIFFGIEQATVGIVPDSYKWIASIFGMRGDVKKGGKQLEHFIVTHSAKDPLFKEALIYHVYLNFYVLSDKEKAWKIVSSEAFDSDSDLFYSFVKANVALNYRNASTAKAVLRKASAYKHYDRYPIFNYEYGYALIRQLDHSAKHKFAAFLKHYKGKYYVKDAWHNLSLIYYLEQDDKKAEYCRHMVIEKGTTIVDEDKHALRVAENNQKRKRLLIEAELLVDGGLYHKALTILTATHANTFEVPEEKVEYLFRLARACDELKDYDKAIRYYNDAIKYGKDLPQHYAARAALQLGFLYEERGEKKNALVAYNLVFSMKNEDFKNSIEQQAKAGVNRLQQ